MTTKVVSAAGIPATCGSIAGGAVIPGPNATVPTADVIKFVLIVGLPEPEGLTLFTVVLTLVPVAINLLTPIVAPRLTVIPKLFAGKCIVPSAVTTGEFKETVVLKLSSCGITCGVTVPCVSGRVKPFTK